MPELPTEFELSAMDRCLELAARGRGSVEPNPLVGALLLRQGKVLAEGWHRFFGGAHAEVDCLQHSSDELTRGATLVVNLEPCSHYGKTPPCADLIIKRGIARVLVGMQDPNPLVAGRGLARLREAGVKVLCGVREREGQRLNRNFICAQTKGRPRVTLKWAQSLDGRVSREYGQPSAISSKASNIAVHQLRAEHPAILVGMRTVVADDPMLNVRLVDGSNPLRCVLDPELEISLSSRLVKSAADMPLHVYHGDGQSISRQADLENKGVRCVAVPLDQGRLDLSFILQDLLAQGRNGLLVEGGPHTHARFLEAGLVDEIVCITSPEVFGSGPRALEDLRSASAFSMVDVTRVGEDCWMRLEERV